MVINTISLPHSRRLGVGSQLIFGLIQFCQIKRHVITGGDELDAGPLGEPTTSTAFFYPDLYEVGERVYRLLHILDSYPLQAAVKQVSPCEKVGGGQSHIA